MTDETKYRLTSTVEMKPLYISLGLPRKSFVTDTSASIEGPFEAVASAEKPYPGQIYLFRGGRNWLFDLQTKKVEGPFTIRENWGGGTWPGSFATGVDAAVWGGEAFPNYIYFFKEDHFIRFNFDNWKVDIAPTPIAEGGWGPSRDTWLANGVDTALHGIGVKQHGFIHFFKGSEYLCYDLAHRANVTGPVPIQEHWKLPEPFATQVNLAFYGTGEEAEYIYFLSEDQCALFDLDNNEVKGVFPLEKKFPTLAQFIRRPQIFLVEYYMLNNYVGGTLLGEKVDSRSVLANQKLTMYMVVEVVETSTSLIKQSILQSQSDEVTKNFYEEMKATNERGGSSEAYRYNFDASFHGDASATGVWGGEVNANVKAKGGTDNVRSNFAAAAFSAVTSQVNKTSKQLTQGVFSSEQGYQRTEKTVSMQEMIIDNSGQDEMVSYAFFEETEPYLSLLSLTDVRLAFADGSGAPRIVPISSMENLLREYIPDQQNREEIRDLIIGELSQIQDYQGVPRSTICKVDQGPTRYEFDTNLTTKFELLNPDGSQEEVQIDGIVKDVKKWMAPTGTLRAIQQ
ncbi:MAG: hypothetical protein R3293_21380 [Candidatus Promineifilaceae bacterium]|nr:hypothetical protein [Candidatus Promineifilaceae bacterium]